MRSSIRHLLFASLLTLGVAHMASAESSSETLTGVPAIANTGWQELAYNDDLPIFEGRRFGPYECTFALGKADVVERVLRTIKLGTEPNEIAAKLCAGKCPDGKTPRPIGFVYKTISEQPVISVKVIPPNDKGHCYYEVSKKSEGQFALRAIDHSGDDLCRCF